MVNVTLTPELVAKIGLALATHSKARKALVGRDTRLSGDMLKKALVSGFLTSGTIVENLGVVPTPVLAYLTRIRNADVGVMITASHNSAPYNGLKVFDHTGTAYTSRHQQEIEQRVKTDQFKLVSWKGVGHELSISAFHRYLKAIINQIQLNRSWKIVVDPGCGATYHLAPELLQRLGCSITTLNAHPDGTFPGRSPEPNQTSLTSIAKSVVALGADLGIAFDGDGDRVAFIDQHGNFADFDQVLAAYAGYVVSQHPKSIVITNVEASMNVEYSVEQKSGRVIRTKVGDIHLSEKIKQHHAIFGGEPCGAWIHPQLNLCPDGLFSAVLLLEALEKTKSDLHTFVSVVPKYPIIRKSIPCLNEQKSKVLTKMQKQIESVFPDCRKVSVIDGIRCSFNKSWMLIRASGTEPLIRLTVEASDALEAQTLLERCITVINDIKGDIEQ